MRRCRFRERDLIVRREQLKAQRSAVAAARDRGQDGRFLADQPATDEGEERSDKRRVDKELAELNRMRCEDPKKYWSKEAQQRELELVQAREQAKASAQQAETPCS